MQTKTLRRLVYAIHPNERTNDNPLIMELRRRRKQSRVNKARSR